MTPPGANYRLFWQEFRRTFHSTGALLPSGRRLCRALARYVPGDGAPRRVLEVGPGTGVATDQILRRLRPGDSLDLVELNERFVAALGDRLAGDPAWQPYARQVRLHHLPIERFAPAEPYHAIVSGLPFNNFPGSLVTSIFAHLAALAAPGATLSFFEYAGIRQAKALVVGRAERKRLAEVEAALASARGGRQFARDLVLANVPPAWVHHLRFDA